MVPAWTVALSYLGYAAMLSLGAACWLAVLFEHVVQGRVRTIWPPKWPRREDLRELRGRLAWMLGRRAERSIRWKSWRRKRPDWGRFITWRMGSRGYAHAWAMPRRRPIG